MFIAYFVPMLQAVSGETVYREYDLVHYFRQFELSDVMDVGKITAKLKHGVLTLH